MNLVADFFLVTVRIRRNPGANVGSLAVNDSSRRSCQPIEGGPRCPETEASRRKLDENLDNTLHMT